MFQKYGLARVVDLDCWPDYAEVRSSFEGLAKAWQQREARFHDLWSVPL